MVGGEFYGIIQKQTKHMTKTYPYWSTVRGSNASDPDRELSHKELVRFNRQFHHASVGAIVPAPFRPLGHALKCNKGVVTNKVVAAALSAKAMMRNLFNTMTEV